MNVSQRQNVKTIIEAELQAGPVSTTSIAEEAGVSRQAIHYHLRRMEREGEVTRIGPPVGRGARYVLTYELKREYDLAGLEEHIAWKDVQQAVTRLGLLPDNVSRIHGHVFTEILNNAVDHSMGQQATVSVRQDDGITQFTIADDGVGAFRHLQETRAIATPEQAIEELSKGRLTTDPEHHTGEGIFFSSKAVDRFVLHANGRAWTVDNQVGDWSISESQVVLGTRVDWWLHDESSRKLESIFDQFTEDHRFVRTSTRVKMYQQGNRLISRSEAKRITSRLDEFEEVILDFGDVTEVGQAFADEVFRVWADSHPEVRLLPKNMSPTVAFMVERAIDR